MNAPRTRRSLFYSQLFSGIGIGLLLGIIIGLSVSPVVKTILGALSGLLAAFLGLQESLFSKQDEDPEKVANRIYLNGIRAGSFGIATVIALLAGMYLRTHGVLSISIEQQVKNWTNAGVDQPLAEELVIYEKFKLFKKESILNVDTKQAELAAEKNNSSDGFLFTKEEMQNYCVALDVEVKWGGSVQNALEGYGGMDPMVVNYATELRNTDENGQREIMDAVKNLACVLGNGTDEEYAQFCKEMNNLLGYSNITESLNDIASSSQVREMGLLANSILVHISEDADKVSLTTAIMGMICKD